MINRKTAIYTVMVIAISLLSSVGLFYYLKTDGFSLEHSIKTKQAIIQEAATSQDPDLQNKAKVASQELALLQQQQIIDRLTQSIDEKQALIANTNGEVTPEAVNKRVTAGKDLIAIQEQKFIAQDTYNKIENGDGYILFTWNGTSYTKKDLWQTILGSFVFIGLLFIKFIIFKDRYMR